MSYLAQNGTALLYIGHVAVLSFLLLTGCTDLNPEKPGTPTDAHLTDSSITGFNALVRHAPVLPQYGAQLQPIGAAPIPRKADVTAA